MRDPILPALASLALGLLSLSGCPASESQSSSGPPQIALTHSWNVGPDASRFYAVDMGSQPPEAAEALMTKMPTVMHKLGVACQDQGWGGNGELVIAFEVSNGEPTSISVAPEAALNKCLSQAVADQGELFTEMPDAKVLVRANYMPSGGT